MTLEFKHHTLSNGLQVVAELNPDGYTAAFGFFVRTGARDEREGELGLSHFLEHMVFKGTNRRTAADVNRELDELGGQANAYTSEEQTVFYMTVIPKYQHRAIDLLTDILRPSLRDEDFQTERQVILEEIAKYDDQPPFGAFERGMELYFGEHPLGNRILGTPQSIGDMTASAMRQYFERRYSPENIVFSAAGCVDFDALIEQLESDCESWPIASDTQTSGQPDKLGCGRTQVPAPDASQTYVIRMGNAPAINSPDRYAMQMLVSIFGDDGGSRLFWELIDTGCADVAAMWTQEFQDVGIHFTYLSCAPEDTEANLEKIDRQIELFAQQGPTADEIEQVKNRICAGLILQSERPSNRMFSVGNAWQLRQSYEPIDQQLEHYRAVSMDDFRRVLDEYPLSSNAEIHTADPAECVS